jgi:hypothetical protein
MLDSGMLKYNLDPKDCTNKCSGYSLVYTLGVTNGKANATIVETRRAYGTKQ